MTLMQLLQHFGLCYQLCIMFKCKQAIQELQKLPEKQAKTGWVFTRIAECYMELLDFERAEEQFLEQIKIEPH